MLLFSDFGAMANGSLEASGVIQVDEIRIASELQGYVTQVSVRAGDAVSAGQALIVLDSSAVQSAIQAAQAAVETARAGLAVVKSAPRSEVVAGKQAQVAIAQAERNKAHAAYQAALAVLRDPQALKQHILEAEALAALAAVNVDVAEAQYAQAQHEADQAEWNSTTRQVLEFRAEAKQAELEAARADERAAQTALKHLQDMEQNPLFYTAKVHAAEGEYNVADAAVKVVQAELRDLVAGATDEEVAVAEASLALPEAQLRLAEMMQQRLTLRSPLSGTVVACMVNVGETALPGVTLLTVADLSELYLTVYVPQTRLGDVFLEQAVHVSVDSFPQRRFEGQVLHIADQAQFTPRSVATKEERVNTVYAVKIRLPNPQGLLKPGMAADAVFRPRGG